MYPLEEADPTHIGRYRLLGRLGSGGMGSVYLGRTPGGRPAAVKVVNAHLRTNPEALDRFRREVETLGTVRNAFTAALIDAEVTTPPFWMATEYVPGPTLADAVDASGPFPVDLARAVLAALAEGLADIHVHGVLHRDIKPQNVILSATGPQLIDFGIARSEAMANITLPGAAIGTPGFIAPETLTQGETGPAADVFALGVTMAYCLTGRAPYGRGSAATVSYRTVHEEMDLAGVPAEMARLIRSCAEKDPARRPEPQRIVELCDSEIDIVRHLAYQRITASTRSRSREDTAAVADAGLLPPDADAAAPAPLAPVVHSAPTVAAGTQFLPPQAYSDPAGASAAVSAPGGRPAWYRRTAFLAVVAVAVVAVVAATILTLRSSGSAADLKEPEASGNHSDSGGGPGGKELPQSMTVRGREVLKAGQTLQTAHVRLVMQKNGNLVSYDKADKPTWASGTSGKNYEAVFQEDGNLVVYTAAHKAVWASNTGASKGAVLELRTDGDVAITKGGRDLFSTDTVAGLPETKTVQAPKTLETGEFLQTAHVKLVMQEDGNLVAYGDDRSRWASRTSGENYKAVFQEDGNLVVYTADDKQVWATDTMRPEGGALLEFRVDGTVAIAKDGRDLWSSGDGSE
ncbi:protein kinase [Streptomyces castrisilvae]|uniref:Protein kinase n=1 Tax=Streptomyces castrisilvae TaxID=3033811 RepID=A0ABY9HSV2_9ACTN|nr:protein kinase [Streptomyces sp. Mut1]WLQ37645.1 protein kinase [Streptomyces sp. Mut1]